MHGLELDEGNYQPFSAVHTFASHSQNQGGRKECSGGPFPENPAWIGSWNLGPLGFVPLGLGP